MKTMKTFEEYRFFPLSINLGSKKDPNEPFFIGPKKKYKEEKKRQWKEARIEREEARRIEREELNQRLKIEKIQKAENEAGKIAEYIEILRNKKEFIFKTGYKKNENNIKYGILLKNGDQLITVYSKNREYEYVFTNVMINDKIMENIKPNMNNSVIDPLGEDNWNEEQKSNVEILGDLIMNIVRKEEIIF